MPKCVEELSRARHLLTAAELAPGNAATLAALTDASKRPPLPREPVPAELQPPARVTLSATAIARALRECKRGSAPGLPGARPEHYKLLLEHSDALALLAEAATGLARADVPRLIAEGLTMTRMTALQKPGGGVRGIAHRRHVPPPRFPDARSSLDARVR